MINYLHSKLHKVERGYDPVPSDHAAYYAETAWQADNETLINEVEKYVGGLAGKRILDLGGGPGHFSVGFAKRGAQVVWHDISRTYMQVLNEGARNAGVEVQISLGYLEEARKFGSEPFDLVFIKQAWYYCMNDRSFAKLVYSLIKPGGMCFITCSIPEYEKNRGTLRNLVYAANKYFYLKIGHPYPPRERIEGLFKRFKIEDIKAENLSETSYKVVFKKAGVTRL